MTFEQCVLVFRNRWKLACSIFVAVVVATIVVSLLLPAQYTARTAIVVDVKSPDPLMGAMLPAQLLPAYMATQVDIIDSDRVAQRVVSLLKMDQSPEVIQQWRDETGGHGSLVVWLGEQLRKKLEIKPSRESNVLSIDYSAPDAELAASIANAFADAYIDTNLELKVEPAKRYAQWFDERTSSLRQDLEAAQHRLSEYQQEHEIIATEDRLDTEVARLELLSGQLVEAQGQRVDSVSRQKQSASAESLPDVMQNPMIAGLKTDIARKEGELGEIGARLGTRHPQYINAEAQLAVLRQRVATEIRNVVRSLGTTDRVNMARESDIQAAVEAQKKKILELRAQRDQIAVLQRDVASAQNAYELVTQRLTQASLESQTQQTNIAVLSRATPPLKPSSPKLLLNLAVALVIGVLLAVAVVLTRELMAPLVRSEDDMIDATGAPVMGTLPPRRESTPRQRKAKASDYPLSRPLTQPL